MLYIIVPVHNRLDKTKAFIDSLKKQSYNQLKLVIVDDGSTDGTGDYIKSHFPEVVVLEGNGKLFWGGGVNMGIAYVNTVAQDDDYVAFANNDVSFESSSIDRLYKKAVTHDIPALFHSLVADGNGVCFTSGSRIISWALFWTRHPFRGLPVEQCRSHEPVRINLATARFLMFRKDVLNLINGIDDTRFLHYLGDCDFSLRLEKKKIYTYIVPESLCYIDNSSTGQNAGNIKGFKDFLHSLTSIRSSNNLRKRFLFGRIHCPPLLVPFYCIAVVLQVFIASLVIRKSRH